MHVYALSRAAVKVEDVMTFSLLQSVPEDTGTLRMCNGFRDGSTSSSEEIEIVVALTGKSVQENF